VIPELSEILRTFGLAPAVGALILAALLTGAVYFAQSIAGCFDDRKS
jgi:hypothetical protein